MKKTFEAKISIRLPLQMKEGLDNLAESEGKSLSCALRERLELIDLQSKVQPERVKSYLVHIQSELAKLLNVLKESRNAMMDILDLKTFISRNDVARIIGNLYVVCFELEKIEERTKELLRWS